MADWKKIPDEFLLMITVRLFSVVKLLHFWSICKSWRSSISPNPFYFKRSSGLSSTSITSSSLCLLTQMETSKYSASTSPCSCHTPPSSTSLYRPLRTRGGWSNPTDLNYGTLHLLNPLTCYMYQHLCMSFDMLQFTISEIGQAYAVRDSWHTRRTVHGFKRDVLVSVARGDDRVLGLWSRSSKSWFNSYKSWS